jgi:hypothetical protein
LSTAGINWCLIQPNRDIALFQFNMMSTQIANVEWKREQETIEDLKILYERDEKNRLQQALKLIPANPFLIL